MKFQEFAPWFLAVIVVLNYGIFCIGRRKWPPGHPWSGVTLLLLAFQQFLSAYQLEIASPLLNSALCVATAITAILWIRTAFKPDKEADEKD